MLLSLRKDVKGLVVSSGETGAQNIIDDLDLPGTFSAASGGFTRCLFITGEIERFLRR
jgi:hypothetical protein